jgi:hypothetical protein
MVKAQMVHAILVVIALIGLDTVLGWLKALVQREWSWDKVANYLQTSVLPFIGGLLALALLAMLQPDVEPVFYASVAAASVKLVADIITKIAGFGVPVEKR